ncbi:MAG TPA: hypothetical protein VMG82_16260 [Candidatus Sulfotelmatobacter sp.]|nr:hypothetical protein [Candidatus Sulfotelmatobacter sp.]
MVLYFRADETETAQMEDPDFVRYEKVWGEARKTLKSQMRAAK